jgi:LmbE family N-acetylglucosaminyl deacetylase
MRKIIVLLTAVLAIVGQHLVAQAPDNIGSAEIYLRLKKLNVLGSVLYIAAHPDDENPRLIAYMAKDRLYRTGYLSMTRGDGGQNLIGDEQGVELGLIRTQEMLAARRVDGAEQFFTRAFDFGFSKSTEETLKFWDKDKILSDVVWVIRRFQPDILITRFPPDSRAGHGHHSASAVLAQEAFAAAADPLRYPEQFKYGVKPWKAKRILWNTFNFGGNVNTTSEDQVKIDVGGFNAILGKSYGELAAESRTNHKSQGAALTPARGQSLEYFSMVAGDPAHGDPMEGVAATWDRVEGGEKIKGMIDQLIKNYSLTDPEKTVPGLVHVYQEIARLKDGYWKAQKLKEAQELIGACGGLWLEASARNGYAVQGDAFPVTFVLNNRLNARASVQEIRLDGYDTVFKQELSADKNFTLSATIPVSLEHPITQPYWLRDEMSRGSYNVRDQILIGDAQSKPAFEARFRLTIEGEDFVFTRPVRYKYTHPVKGELYEPVTVLPRITGEFDPELTVFSDGEEKSFEVQTSNHAAHDDHPKLSVTPTAGVSVRQTPISGTDPGYSAKPTHKEWTFYPPLSALDPHNGDEDEYWNSHSNLLFSVNGKTDTVRQLKTISYDHIPRIDYFRPAREKFVYGFFKIAGKRIGYIEGAGDKVPQALEQMGYEVTLLKEKDIVAGILRQFDAIITGVRAYDIHDWLFGKYETLMDYVKGGGNLVVQYNRNNIGNNKVKIGPYPFAISNIRVTDEEAKVNLVDTASQVLNYPNKITDFDFAGWIQERGIYFAGNIDPAYETPLSMKDPGEQEQKGSLIIAHYGRGTFEYTGLVFFRELPAGIPGAYRLFANIIGLNHKK